MNHTAGSHTFYKQQHLLGLEGSRITWLARALQGQSCLA